MLKLETILSQSVHRRLSRFEVKNDTFDSVDENFGS